MALNNVPLSGQTLGITRTPINSNFLTVNAAFLVDHVEYNTGGQGKHNKVTFPVQAMAPVFAGGDIGLYSYLYATTNTNEIFYSNQASNQIPMTASKLSQVPAPAALASGWTYLPSGIILKWGKGTTTVMPVGQVTFNPDASGGPAFTQILNFQVSVYQTIAGNPTVVFQGYAKPQVTINTFLNGVAANNVGFIWFALGY